MTLPPSPSEQNHLRGILAMLLAIACFSVMYALVKFLATIHSVVEISFFRSLFGIIPLALMMRRQPVRAFLKTKNLRGHLARGICGTIAMMLYFLSFRLLPIADATALGYTNAIFIALFAGFFLKERSTAGRWIAILAGFAGTALMVRPGGHDLDPAGIGVALGASVTSALAMIGVRALGKTEKPVTTVLYFMLISTTLSGIALPFFWTAPTGYDLLLLLACGLIGGVAQLLMTRAYQLAPAPIVSPFSYSTILWATLFGWLFWNEWPTPQVLLGGAVVIAAGLYIAVKESQSKPTP